MVGVLGPATGKISLPGPLDYEKRRLEEDGRIAEAELFTDRRGLYLWQIEVIAGERGHGTGTKLLAALCAEADRRGLQFRLTAVSGGTLAQTHRLVEWYRRHGFVAVEWDDAGGCRMRRLPRKKGA